MFTGILLARFQSLHRFVSVTMPEPVNTENCAILLGIELRAVYFKMDGVRAIELA